MISWIQTSFQRHFRLIFVVLLGVTIISFIVTIGASSGSLGQSGRGGITRDFFGHNMASQTDMQQLNSDAAMSVELQIGYTGMDEQQLQQYALQRAAALHLAQEWHLPAPTSEQQVDFIKGLRVFADEKGQFDSIRYDGFRRSLQNNPRTSEADIARVVSDDAEIQTVRQLLDGPGYVLPADVRASMIRADTTWTIGYATVDYTSFKPTITPSDTELGRYFQDNAFRYQIAPRVVASVVEFPAINYLGQVQVTDAEVRAYYAANPAQFPAPAAAAGKDKAGKPLPTIKADPAQDFAAVRPQVEASLRLVRAKNLAAKAASDLAYALYQAKVTIGPALNAFLTSHHVSAKALAPFTADAGPAELGGSPELAAAAFKLDSQQYFTEALPTPAGAAILLWKEQLPPRTPLLSEVRAKVLADYTEAEKRKRFVQLGSTLHNVIVSRLKAGESFDKAAGEAANGGIKIEVKTLAPFNMRNRPKDLNATVAGALENLNKVYAADKRMPNLNEAGPEFNAMRLSIAGYMARLGANNYLSEIVASELKRTEPKVQ
jgi:peptidyl-prolyl cis-trans isomerase D